MLNLDSTAIDGFSAAVSSGADEAASAFERAFGTEIKIKVGSPLPLAGLGPKIPGKGLAIALYHQSGGIGILIPASTGLIPGWCENPDPTGKSKLATFAQEWGMNLVPEDFFPDDYKATLVDDLQYSLNNAQPGERAACLEILVDDLKGTPVPVYLVWPLQEPDGLLRSAEPETALPPPPQIGNEEAGEFDPFSVTVFGERQDKRLSLDDLPGYGRSTLKVRVPVATVLARARKPIKTILELGIGSVIQFDKSCDEPLEIEVGQSMVIADAEAVKVGDKFGFRINSIFLPKERFRKVKVRLEGEYHIKQNQPQIIGKAPIKTLAPDI